MTAIKFKRPQITRIKRINLKDHEFRELNELSYAQQKIREIYALDLWSLATEGTQEICGQKKQFVKFV